MVDKNYKPGRAVVVGVLVGLVIGLMTRHPFMGPILGLWIGLAVDSTNQTKRDQSQEG